DGTRWLKFNDSKQWMISRFSDGRPLGEAFVWDDSEEPSGIRELWHVCSEAKTWEEDDQISVTSGQCQGCGKSLLRALRCGQCRAVSYCSSSCQKADWRYHKRRCCRAAVAPRAQGEEGRHCDASGPQEVFKSREIPTPCGPAAPSPATCRQRSSPLASGSVGPGSWEEIDLMVWARRRLEILLGGPEELEGLPEMRVPCADVGGLEVVGVKEVEGLAAVWPNSGGLRRHLFDLSFQVVFKATWLGDFGLVSMEGLVFCDDFTSNLVSDPEAACGMMVDFAHSVDSFLEVARSESVLKVSYVALIRLRPHHMMPALLQLALLPALLAAVLENESSAFSDQEETCALQRQSMLANSSEAVGSSFSNSQVCELLGGIFKSNKCGPRSCGRLGGGGCSQRPGGSNCCLGSYGNKPKCHQSCAPPCNWEGSAANTYSQCFCGSHGSFTSVKYPSSSNTVSGCTYKANNDLKAYAWFHEHTGCQGNNWRTPWAPTEDSGVHGSNLDGHRRRHFNDKTSSVEVCVDSRAGVLAAANLFEGYSYRGRRLTLICDPTQFMSQTSKECAVPSPDQVGFGSTDGDPFSIVLWTVGTAISVALDAGLKVLAAGALSVATIKLALAVAAFGGALVVVVGAVLLAAVVIWNAANDGTRYCCSWNLNGELSGFNDKISSFIVFPVSVPMRMENKDSRWCLTAAGSSSRSANGNTWAANAVYEASCSGTDREKWYFQEDGQMINFDSGLCLDESLGGRFPVNDVYEYRCTGSDNQKWERLSDGRFRNIKTRRCLDASRGGQFSRHDVYTYACSRRRRRGKGHNNQWWMKGYD
ncbi:ath, partial [Symbiodinium sp. KB8]